MNINNHNKRYNFIHENFFHHYADKSRFEKILNHYELFKLSKNIKGEVVELGVFKGTSLIRFAHFRDALKVKKTIYGFDTFTKFPNNKSKNLYDKSFPKNFKTIAGNPMKVSELMNILKKKKIKKTVLVKGDIYKTLKKFLKKKKKIALLHLDLDTEDITKYAIETLYPIINKGAIIILDDFKIHKGIDRAIRKSKLKNFKILKPFYGKNPHYIIKS